MQESIMDNAKAFLKQAENPMPMDFNIQELKKISSVPTFFVKGKRRPKFYHRIVDILAQQLPRSEEPLIACVIQNVNMTGLLVQVSK
jgi:hypothetical protein